MDVLNTYGGGINEGVLLIAILAGLLGSFLFIGGMVEDGPVEVLFGILLAAIAIAAGMHTHEPVRHEVTLRPGHVIDAAKYEVIEQRGRIYVIEEREEDGR
ncbi:hypothetical protein D1872_222350 [compost metagenome]